MNAAAQQVAENATQWVTFSLGDEIYGIDVMVVQEVLRVSEIAPVPGAPSYVLGIINLRGNVVTVLDARQRFGLPSRDPEEASRIVIIESGGDVVGVLVDGVAEVMEIAEEAIESPPGVGVDESMRFSQGVHSRDDTLVILVDVTKLLGGDDWIGG